MAVIDNVEITISSNGSALQEYAVPANDDAGVDHGNQSDATKIVKCYIEAVPGANFEIRYSIKEGQEFGNADYLSLNTWVDGQKVLAPIVEPRHLRHADEMPNAAVNDIKARYDEIGSIRVEFSRKKHLGFAHEFEPVSLNEEPIPEKAIKGQALDLGVGLQSARPKHSPVKVHRGEILDEGPLATFIFLYRSKNALQILGILPRTPEPIPLEERDPATLSPAEMLELIRRQQSELEATKAKVKKEEAELDMPRSDTIKREATDEDDDLAILPVPQNRVRKKVEVIDLTDD
ncbi:hypothetical protein A1O7_05768 [Cladophialophora yegresii CBS 114405]|uniref:DUF7918 domain-containing protein n=1 Tax=Cladophialophora yegresii CBS 114405 TaxID=1182544 RepID=W9VS37_9EURO|nr:uncharacterized protein A1O7_05768 [Cladophialophora yegresii CBS 114405]EXJ58343.1 hypothetical protein A1O7_05768 [Cladophialophora yegresii CBS 114405]